MRRGCTSPVLNGIEIVKPGCPWSLKACIALGLRSIDKYRTYLTDMDAEPVNRSRDRRVKSWTAEVVPMKRAWQRLVDHSTNAAARVSRLTQPNTRQATKNRLQRYLGQMVGLIVYPMLTGCVSLQQVFNHATLASFAGEVKIEMADVNCS
jgi:hypothetical protein